MRTSASHSFVRKWLLELLRGRWPVTVPSKGVQGTAPGCVSCWTFAPTWAAIVTKHHLSSQVRVTYFSAMHNARYKGISLEHQTLTDEMQRYTACVDTSH